MPRKESSLIFLLGLGIVGCSYEADESTLSSTAPAASEVCDLSGGKGAELARRYAPVVQLHPEERFLPGDPLDFWREAQQHGPGAIKEKLNKGGWTDRYIDFDVAAAQARLFEKYKHQETIDDVPVLWREAKILGYSAIQYGYFYPEQGPSLGRATADFTKANGKEYFKSSVFELHMFGNHPGDWEEVVIRFDGHCKPYDVTTKRHGIKFEDTLPYELMEKVSFQGAQHPLIYSALNTHASQVRSGVANSVNLADRDPTGAKTLTNFAQYGFVLGALHENVFEVNRLIATLITLGRNILMEALIDILSGSALTVNLKSLEILDVSGRENANPIVRTHQPTGRAVGLVWQPTTMRHFSEDEAIYGQGPRLSWGYRNYEGSGIKNTNIYLPQSADQDIKGIRRAIGSVLSTGFEMGLLPEDLLATESMGSGTLQGPGAPYASNKGYVCLFNDKNYQGYVRCYSAASPGREVSFKDRFETVMRDEVESIQFFPPIDGSPRTLKLDLFREPLQQNLIANAKMYTQNEPDLGNLNNSADSLILHEDERRLICFYNNGYFNRETLANQNRNFCVNPEKRLNLNQYGWEWADKISSIKVFGKCLVADLFRSFDFQNLMVEQKVSNDNLADDDRDDMIRSVKVRMDPSCDPEEEEIFDF